jgi:hypothetical protein
VYLSLTHKYIYTGVLVGQYSHLLPSMSCDRYVHTYCLSLARAPSFSLLHTYTYMQHMTIYVLYISAQTMKSNDAISILYICTENPEELCNDRDSKKEEKTQTQTPTRTVYSLQGGGPWYPGAGPASAFSTQCTYSIHQGAIGGKVVMHLSPVVVTSVDEVCMCVGGYVCGWVCVCVSLSLKVIVHLSPRIVTSVDELSLSLAYTC